VTRFNLRVLAGAGSILLLVAAVAVAEEISAQDRAKLVQYLTGARDQVLAEAAALSDAQWSFKPGPDRWSVGEVVEHLALAESLIFDLQQRWSPGRRRRPSSALPRRARTRCC
jgi:hypothetical protein